MAEHTSSKAKVVDIHTHMYPPEYVKILESRNDIPLVRSFPSSPDPRLILLSAEVPLLQEASKQQQDETNNIVPGRPLTKHYSSLSQKIHFMDTHGIDISVISLANPWLIEVAMGAASVGERKSSQGLAREMTDMSMPWVSMK